jgi:hypothetical protein
MDTKERPDANEAAGLRVCSQTPNTVPDPLAICNPSVAYLDDDLTPEDLAQARADLDAMLGRGPAEIVHASDCALHDEPALPTSPCNCSALYDEPPHAIEPTILRRIEQPNAVTIHLPTHGRIGRSYQAHAVLRHGCPHDERVITTMQQLWRRNLLPFWALTFDAYPDKLIIGLDLADPEQLPIYQAKLDRLAWAFPWPITAAILKPFYAELADAGGLGLRHYGDCPQETQL